MQLRRGFAALVGPVSFTVALSFVLPGVALAADPPLYLSGPSELGFVLRQGALVVARCRASRCDFDHGVAVPVPEQLLGSVAPAAFTRLELDDRRVVVRVRLPVEDRAWEALVTLPVAAGAAPEIPFADFTGTAVNDEGERAGKWIEVDADDRGHSEVVVGSLRDDVTLCGRRTLLDPKVLYPKDLELHRVKLMRLSREERASAQKLVVAVDDPKGGTSISRAVAASSAKGSPAALSDGRSTTEWAEDRGGDGSGEFVVFRTPDTLPVSQVYWTYPSEPGSVPTAFWVATDTSLYRVEVPADIVAPGASLSVTLPQPETTSCVALVLDSASASAADQADQDVSLAEFGARAAVDEAAIEALVSRLGDPNEDGDALVRTLSALGKGAVRILSRRYDQLSPVGRSRALVVYDSLPCEETARAYARAIGGAVSDRHAAERLGQCGAVGEKAALKQLRKGPAARTRVLASLLASTNPKRAAAELVPLLAKGNRERRKALRAALGSIASDPNAHPVLLDWLGKDDLDGVAAVDLLRALGEHLGEYQPAASARLLALLEKEPSFRDRYLLLAPAAALATSDPALAEYLTRSLNQDSETAVRARAARVLPVTKDLLPALLSATQQRQVRVREAAILNLGEHRVEQASAVLLQRAKSDPWPFVRAASVRGLVDLAPSATIDRALAERAENDESPDVRRPALLGLGSRNARAEVETVRNRLDDDDEDPYVRAAAAASLGMLCDASSLDDLTRHARAISRLNGDEAQQVIGRAALSALGRIAPSDLKQRLRAFDDPEAPPWAKQAADAALDYPEPCGH